MEVAVMNGVICWGTGEGGAVEGALMNGVICWGTCEGWLCD